MVYAVTQLTLLTRFMQMKLLYTAKTLACIPLYTVREGKNAIGIECWSGETTRAPAVQKGAF